MDIGSILLGKMENDVKILRQEFQQIYAEIKDISKKIAELYRKRSEKEKIIKQFDNELKHLNREIEENIKIKSPRELKTLIAEQKIKMSVTEFQRKLVLQDILQKRRNLAESESARIGAQIGNIFKRAGREDLSKMAYFDPESRSFKWLED